MASSIVGALKIVLGADTAPFKSGLGEASNAAKQFTGDITGQFKGITTTMAGLSKTLGLAFGVGAIATAAGKIANFAGELSDLSGQTGLTTRTLQEMSHAATLTGTSLEAFTNAAFKLGTNLAGGSNSVEAAVNKLGLSYQALLAQSPDEQFRTIAAALGQVEDAQQRNKLAVDLFGKSAKQILPAIADGYDRLADAASVAGDRQIKAIDEAADALDELKNKALATATSIAGSILLAIKKEDELTASVNRNKVAFDYGTVFEALGLKATKLPTVLNETATAAGNLPAPLRASATSADDLEKAAGRLDAELAISVERNKAAADAATEFAASLRELSGEQAAAGAKNVLKQLEALGGPLKVLPGQLEQMADQLREGAQAALLVGDADLAARYTQLANTLNPVTQFQQRFNVTIGEYVTNAPKAAAWTEEMNEQLHTLGGTITTIGPSFEALTSSLNLSAMLEPLKRGFNDNLSPGFWTKAWSGMTAGLSKTLGDVSQTIAAAFTGGGDIMGAIKSIASQIGTAIGGSIGAAFGPLGQKIGGAIGSMAGLLVGSFKKLFGIGINDDIKKFNQEIDKSRDKLLEQYGSLERIDRIGRVVGVDLAAAWNHQGEAGKRAFEKIAKEFEAAVSQMEADLDDLQGELDTTFSNARDLGYVFDKDGNLVSVSFDKMQAKAEEFGVSVDALGPAFQGQRIAADAQGIIDAFTLLSKGGTDAGTILFGMKDEISKLVQESITFKTTIPENMRPWIQNLIDTHQLLDENGQEITDIGKINFGAAVETQFEAISRKIGDLIDRIGVLIDTLQDKLTPALDEATRDRNVHIGVTTDPIPQFVGADGGDNHGYTEPGFDVGTKGRLGSWFANFPKTGFNTSLHGVEAVVRQDQAVPFAMDVLSGLGQSASQPVQQPTPKVQAHFLIEHQIIMDGQEMKNWQKRTIVTALDDNEGGFRSDLQGLIGVTG